MMMLNSIHEKDPGMAGACNNDKLIGHTFPGHKYTNLSFRS